MKTIFKWVFCREHNKDLKEDSWKNNLNLDKTEIKVLTQNIYIFLPLCLRYSLSSFWMTVLLLQDIAVLLWPDELSMPFWLYVMSLHLFSTAWGCVTVVLQETVMVHQHPNVNLFDSIKVTKLLPSCVFFKWNKDLHKYDLNRVRRLTDVCATGNNLWIKAECSKSSHFQKVDTCLKRYCRGLCIAEMGDRVTLELLSEGFANWLRLE